MVLLAKVVTIIFYTLALLILFIVLQILTMNQYSMILVDTIIAIGYGFTSIIMSILAYRLLSWFNFNKSLIVLIYALAAITFVINAVSSLVLFEQLLVEKPVVFSFDSLVEFDFECQPGSLKCFLIDFQSYTLSAYFLTMWVGGVILLSNNIKRLGKAFFCLLTVLPIITFYLTFISAYDELYQISSTVSKVETDIVMMSLIISLETSCGILYALGFRSVGFHIKSSNDVRDFMIICAYGIILYFIAANSTTAAAGYPIFGIISILFVPISSFLILLGLYNSAVTIAHDSNLRKEIKTSLLKGKLLDQIGNAELVRDMEENILKTTRDKAIKIIEQSGVEPSLSDTEIREYLEDIIGDRKKIDG